MNDLKKKGMFWRSTCCNIISFTLCIIGFNAFILAQSQSKPKHDPISKTSCEEVINVLDRAYLQKLKETFVIVVFHQGKGEKKNSNVHRVRDIQNFLIQRTFADDFVLTEGTELKNQPLANVYVNGALFERLYFNPKSKTKFCD